MFRYFHNSSIMQSVSKSALAKLRKKTGYTFSNCRKALELHENDVTKAEEWLREQAKALGWAKASKLEGRSTIQGLVGVSVNSEKAVMVEVNCETDFVARNSKFKTLVEMVTATCLKQPFSSQTLAGDELKSLRVEDGSILHDHVTLVIGSVGENITLRRAFCYSASPGLLLAGCTHPLPETEGPILLGRYGALVAYTALESPETKNLGRQLCQHVIGMNPRTVGEIGVGDAAENPDDENVMVNQEYLLDPAVTVGQVLSDFRASVVSFCRYECGEAVDVVTTDNVERSEVRAEG